MRLRVSCHLSLPLWIALGTFVACSTTSRDADDAGNQGGEGGDHYSQNNGGTGGSRRGGSGGSQNGGSGGEGGTAGDSGVAGMGGNNQAGTGGGGGDTGGAGGEAGAGGEDGTAGEAGAGGEGGTAGEPSAGGAGGEGDGYDWGGNPPSKFLPELTLVPVGDRMAYNPHRNYPFTVKGSGHTHCDDGSNTPISCADQLERFRDLEGTHKHDFLWLTANNVVQPTPDPAIDGILHMFGIEVYTMNQMDGANTPHIVGLLPEGALPTGMENPLEPVGFPYRPWGERLQRIAAVGGLPVIAHPSSSGFTGEAGPSVLANNASSDLWGIEVLNPSVVGSVMAGAIIAEQYVDARLDAGKYVCLSGGTDAYGTEQNWKVTRGYQLVSTQSATPTRAELFAEVKACNFFVCASNPEGVPFTNPSLEIEDGKIVFSIEGNPSSIEFVGEGGEVLHTVTGAGTASFEPPASQPYVRVRAFRNTGSAVCFSQAVWFVESDGLPAGDASVEDALVGDASVEEDALAEDASVEDASTD